MNNFIEQLTGILTTTPGNLIFHLVVTFSIAITIQVVLIANNSDQFPQFRRLIFGLSVLLVGQIVLFLSSGLAWQGIVTSDLFLPPLDRAISVISLTWIIWLWGTDQKNKTIDIFAGLASLIILVCFIGTLVFWSYQPAEVMFNGLWIDSAWQCLFLIIILIGLDLLVSRRYAGWAACLSILIILGVGSLIQLFWPDTHENLPAYIRLAQLCSYPLLANVVQKITIAKPVQTVPDVQQIDQGEKIADAAIIYDWLKVAQQRENEKIIATTTKAIAHTLNADLCFLVSFSIKENQIEIQEGYNPARKEYLKGVRLSPDLIPNLSNAIREAKPFYGQVGDQAMNELETLKQALNLEQIGFMLFAPITTSHEIWGGVLLFFMEADPQKTETIVQYIASLSSALALLLQKPEAQPVTEEETDNEESLKTLTEQLTRMIQENQSLREQMDRMQQVSRSSPELDELLAIQQDTQDMISNLQRENQQLKDRLKENLKVDPATKLSMMTKIEPEDLQSDLRIALVEMEHLKTELTEANMRLHEMSHDEKVSPLELQSLIDDLVKITSTEVKTPQTTSISTDFEDILDQAFAENRRIFRDKNLSLRLDVSENLPRSKNPMVIQEVITQLLKNAGTVTPVNGKIQIKVATVGTNGQSNLHIWVTDQGGGVPSKDWLNIFKTTDRTDLVYEGVSQGINFSNMKSLVDSTKGKITLMSDSITGSTFQVIFPLNSF